MESFLKDLTTPNWWMGVVVVGILINLVSPLIGTMLGRSSSRLLSYWRVRSEKQRTSDQRLVERLRSSEYERVMAATQEVSQLLRATLLFVAAVFLCLIGLVSRGEEQMKGASLFLMIRVGLYILSTINFMIAVSFLLRARALREALGRAMEPSGANQEPVSRMNQAPPSGP